MLCFCAYVLLLCVCVIMKLAILGGVQMIEEKKFYTVTEIAKSLRVSRNTVLRWLNKGILRGYRSGRQWRIAEDDFEQWLEQRANQKEE